MKKHYSINALNKRLDDYGRQVLEGAAKLTLQPNSKVFGQGDICQNYLLVLEGSVKVFSRTAAGREILLYRVQAGESCTLTTSCLLANDKYPAQSITESEVTALAISRKEFDLGLQHSDKFRQFVFNSYGERIRDVISLVETVSFGKIEVRLAQALLDEASDLRLIKITHQQLAVDLGTAREVVSRHLKTFERRDWLQLFRGGIEITDFKALEEVAKELC